MKDYRLSEIKKICEEHHKYSGGECKTCPIFDFCSSYWISPRHWEIDEKDGEEE